MQYAEDHNWDTLNTRDVIDSAKSVADTVQQFVHDQTGWGSPPEKPSKAAQDTARTMSEAVTQSKDRIVHAAGKLKTTVKKSEDTVTAVVKHQSIQFSSGVQALVEEVEAALAGKPKPKKTKKTAPVPVPELTTSPEQPELTLRAQSQSATDTKEASPLAEGPKNVYDAPLPLGFEPPPGFSKPKPPPLPAAPEIVEAPPAPPPLPLITPEISEHAGSEPIIGQLATTIDNLTVFLNSNPAAAEKAHGVIDTAKLDLMNLASRIEKIKQDERAILEQQLDDQAREYTVKILELEMASQDKFDSQEDEFKKLFDEERARLIEAYREKLSQELQTQSEIINERYATLI
jgi:mitofilin